MISAARPLRILFLRNKGSDNVGQEIFFLVGVAQREDNFLSTLEFFDFQPIPDAALFFFSFR